MKTETIKADSGFICCLCKKISYGWGDKAQWGNNPQPLAKGECCDECNRTKVIPARIKLMQEKGRW